MVLEWFSGGKRVDLPDLLAKKKYGKAIEVMRAQFKESPPTVETRLLFVDCLILAGRGKEAVPVLIGLADEVLADGQAPKALGLLKRAQQIEPDQPDVEAKLASLVKKEFEAKTGEFVLSEIESPRAPDAAPAPPPPPPPARSAAKVTVSNRVAFDLEEIPEAERPPEAKAAEAEPVTLRIRGAFRRFLSTLPGGEEEARTPALDAGTDTLPPAPEDESPVEVEFEPLDARGVATDEPLAIQTDEPLAIETGDAPRADAAEPGPEPQLETEPEVEAEPELEPEIEPEAEQPQAAALASADIKVEFEREEPEPEIEAEVEAEIEPEAAAPIEIEPQPEPEVAAEPKVAAEAPADVELSPEAAQLLAALDPQPDVAPEPAVGVRSEAKPAPEQRAEPEPEPAEEPMSEAAFQGQVLDLMQEVVQNPHPAPAPEAQADDTADEKAVRTRGVAESAQQLLASPLFRELKEGELLAVVRGMHLHTYEAGDLVLTEGEPGDSLFIVTSGAVRVFVRNPAGHNFEMGVLKEGEFFGEISSLSGRPRTGTVVATCHTELLELGKVTVDQIAHTYPRVRETLETYYIKRASSPEAAAIRAVPVDPGSRQRAIDVLEAYFGESRWDPRMRLRLADLLVKAGKEEDAVPLLVGLADDLDRAGFPEKAIAILKKIEKIRKRGTREVNLAPLARKKSEPKASPKAAAPAAPHPGHAATAEHFSNWIVDVVRDAVVPKPTPDATSEPKPPGYAHGLLATPLFEGLSEDELLTMIRELRLNSFDPGDIILTEGERGQSLFILTAGTVKIHVKSAHGKNVPVAELRAGSFFGEMASVSGKPRTATVTAAQPVELLELDKQALDAIATRHPRIREVLEDVYMTRAESPEATRARSSPPRS